MMLNKHLLLLAMLLVAANGSDIYATLYPGDGCSNVGDSVSFKMTVDVCTQIPQIRGEGIPGGPCYGAGCSSNMFIFTTPLDDFGGSLYGLTTYDSQSSEYYTAYSLKSDCSEKMQNHAGGSPFDADIPIPIDTCNGLELMLDMVGAQGMRWTYSQKFSDAYDADATVALDCTTTRPLVASATTPGCGGEPPVMVALPVMGSSSCSTCDGLAFIASAGFRCTVGQHISASINIFPFGATIESIDSDANIIVVAWDISDGDTTHAEVAFAQARDDSGASCLSTGICTGCMDDADNTPITQDNVGDVVPVAAPPPAKMCIVNVCIPAASEPTSQTLTCQSIKTAYKSQSCCNNPNNPFTVPTSSARRLLRSAPSGDSQVVDLVVSKLSNWNTLLNKGLISAQEYSTRRTRLLESLA